MGITTLLQNMVRERMRPRFYGRILDDHVLDEGFSSQVFEADEGYFEIRVSEMFLRDKREYWRGFIPFTVVLSEFIYNDKREVVPFFVGNQLLKSIERYIEGEHVEYRNTRVVGPVPYVGDDVSLFVGLFRAQVSDLSETLFGFLENIVTAFDITTLSTYLDIARPFTVGLAGLLGMKEIEPRICTRDVFNNKPDDFSQFKECYLAYINCPEDSIHPDKLWVKENRLFSGTDKEPTKPVRKHDYCLIKIDHLPKISFTTLPFHKLWKEAYGSIHQGNYLAADRIKLSLIHQVAMSPDIITHHRHQLIQAYEANFQKAIETHEGSGRRHSSHTSAVTRGNRGGKDLSARAVIQKTAALAERVGFSKETRKGLLEISTNWDSIPYLKDRPEDFELNEETLNEQLNELEIISKIKNPDPKALADAISVAALSPA